MRHDNAKVFTVLDLVLGMSNWNTAYNFSHPIWPLSLAEVAVWDIFGSNDISEMNALACRGLDRYGGGGR